jgi:hypothetical protein
VNSTVKRKKTLTKKVMKVGGVRMVERNGSVDSGEVVVRSG